MIYREGLGRPLSWAELDSNFKSVDDIGRSAQAAATSARTDATIATTAQSAATASAVTAGASAVTAKAEADRASQIAGLDTVADAVGLCNAPFPDVWIPFNDSLRMIAGYGENIQVGGETVAVKATFSRASTATYIDKSGALRTAAVNEPRFEREGLLIEGQSTNLLLNSGTLATQSVTVADGSYTLSFYGSGSVTLSGAATGVLGGNGVGRVSLTVAAVAGVLVLTVSGTCTNAQLEALPFASSYIPTTGAAATRAADVCSFTPSNNIAKTDVTLVSEWHCPDRYQTGSNARRPIISMGSSVLGYSLIHVYKQTSDSVVRFGGVWGLSNVSDASIGTSVDSESGVCFARHTNETLTVGGSIVGESVLISSPSPADHTLGSVVYIGTNGSTRVMFGHIRNFRIWHRALTDAQLKSLR